MRYVIYILLGLVALFLLTFLIFFITACIASALADPQKTYNKDHPFFRFMLYSFAWIFLTFGRARIHVIGKEKLPEGRFLLVSNHRSKFDPILQFYSLRKKTNLSYVSKEENFHIFLIGRMLWPCCFLVIDRDNPKNAILTIRKASELLMNDAVSIGIFPEGTRNTGDGLLPFKNGAFKIAQKANVPIVVVATKGADMIHKNFPLHHTDVYLEIVETIPADFVTNHKTDEIGERVYRDISTTLEKYNNS